MRQLTLAWHVRLHSVLDRSNGLPLSA